MTSKDSEDIVRFAKSCHVLFKNILDKVNRTNRRKKDKKKSAKKRNLHLDSSSDGSSPNPVMTMETSSSLFTKSKASYNESYPLEYFSQNLYNQEELCVDNLLPSLIIGETSSANSSMTWKQHHYDTSFNTAAFNTIENEFPNACYSASDYNCVTFYNPCHSSFWDIHLDIKDLTYVFCLQTLEKSLVISICWRLPRHQPASLSLVNPKALKVSTSYPSSRSSINSNGDSLFLFAMNDIASEDNKWLWSWRLSTRFSLLIDFELTALEMLKVMQQKMQIDIRDKEDQ